ncbi:MAG: DUF4159 domain-containing protein [Proteobacteria bacterium]|nr:DUF4159 domain-containing protein [Pseudomonadota bacterium]
MSGLLPAVGFASPWLLWGLVLLPLVWLLLRVLPPAPVLRRFPGVALLLGLADRDAASVRTPPWLLALRLGALALAILGFAGPILNPSGHAPGQGPLLILADASWADGDRWPRLRERLLAEAGAAAAAGRPLALVSLTGTEGAPRPEFGPAAPVLARLGALEPAAWAPPEARMAALAAALPGGRFETLWQSDGLGRAGRGALLAALAAHGPVRVLQSGAGLLALTAPTLAADGVATRLLRPAGGGAEQAALAAFGPDPAGIERELARQPVALPAGATDLAVTLALPPELRNRMTRIEVAGRASAGAVVLADDALRRRKVGIVEAQAPREGLELLSPAHYLRQALKPGADLVEGTLADILPAAPQVIILADVARLPDGEQAALTRWVGKGGLLVRFAGPRLAASVEPGAAATDPLLPVALRPGDRALGGSMSWETPRRLAPFAATSPFAGLPVPADVTVRTQVLAEPGPGLAARTIASLEDGTPLVTEAGVGAGRVVLFHVTASADWSNLPLSGLFVKMLDRLAASSLPGQDSAADMAGTVWTAERQMDAYGGLQPAEGLAGVPGDRLARGEVGPDMPPGLYRSGERRVSLNVLPANARLTPARWPASVTVETGEGGAERALKGIVLALALGLLAVEGLATLLVTGRIAPRRRVAPALVPLAAALLIGLGAPPHPARAANDAATDERLIASAGGMVLAHVLTGDADLDRRAEAGLAGLSMVLTQRTSVEPGPPVGVDPEKDDLSVYTFLYWPVSAAEPMPSAAAYRQLNLFLHTGGLILFDTRDGDGAQAPGTSPEALRLQELAAPLDIPPLAPIPHDHVLTRAFYLIDGFPGRYEGNPVWAEAPPPDAEQAAGMPFRNLNDGVTPVVIGGNDWATAWAVDQDGNPAFPVGRGVAGERQREMAFRFGVNLVMHVLTGNYKSDQVHVPALLERLGQ